MSVLLASLVLNEMEWLPLLYKQHLQWPELVSWVFVEAVDRQYQKANPEMISPEGLSVDGTSQFLQTLAETDPRVTYIPHGFSDHPDPAVCKAQARQRYLEVAADVKPTYVIALDADEFYTREDQEGLVRCMDQHKHRDAFVFHRREIWRPPAYASNWSLFSHEVVGGFWEIACCHWWRWQPGMHYGDCHNAPNGANGQPLNWNMERLNKRSGFPQMIHLGYAAQEGTRKAKNRYYETRGEAEDPLRSWYVESRAAWETWQVGWRLPKRAKVIPYKGPVPECFQ